MYHLIYCNKHLFGASHAFDLLAIVVHWGCCIYIVFQLIMLNFCVYKLGIKFGKQLINNAGCINLAKHPNGPHRGADFRSMGNVPLQNLI